MTAGKILSIQKFLNRRMPGLNLKEDGIMGSQTANAIYKWQGMAGLEQTGFWTVSTENKAKELGYQEIGTLGFGLEAPKVKRPQRPASVVALGAEHAWKKFGGYAFKHTPSLHNREAITILSDWEKEKLTEIVFPYTKQLIRIHKLVAKQTEAMFKEWFSRYPHVVKTFDGAFVPRFRRGTKPHHMRLPASSAYKYLSNHAWGTAIDINARWNPFRHPGAKIGEEGSVWELVPIATKYGYYWGGWFNDAMHFEVFKIV